MSSPRNKLLPRLFWAYLLAAHLLYALFALGMQWFSELAGHWPLRLSLPSFVTLIDIIVAPACAYAWLRRSEPMAAFCGALALALVGVLAAAAWQGPDVFRSMVDTFAVGSGPALALLIGAAVVAYEARVLIEVAALSRRKNLDESISERSLASPGDGRLVALGRRWLGIELRFWSYALVPKAPNTESFQGCRHFGYGQQSSNAATWRAWAVINLAPTPLIHLILHQVNPLAAALTTLATLLASLWCWAEARAARFRPLSFDTRWVYLRYGLLVDRRIPVGSILAARMLGWQDFDRRNVSHHAGCGAANVELQLDCGETIHLGLDSPGEFLAALEQVRGLAPCEGRTAPVG